MADAFKAWQMVDGVDGVDNVDSAEAVPLSVHPVHSPCPLPLLTAIPTFVIIRLDGFIAGTGRAVPIVKGLMCVDSH